VLTHTAPPAGVATDCQLDGPVGALRVLQSGTYATGIVVDAERRRIYAGECSAGRVTVCDADRGRQVAEVRRKDKGYGSAADVALIDGVLVTSDFHSNCLHFLAVDAIRGLK
jgi:hypothetical protein